MLLFFRVLLKNIIYCLWIIKLRNITRPTVIGMQIDSKQLKTVFKLLQEIAFYRELIAIKASFGMIHLKNKKLKSNAELN